MTVRQRHARRGSTLLLVLAVLLAACRGGDDPATELRSAIETTASEPFRFAVSAQADRAALDELGGDAVAAATFLDGAGVTGARDPDGWLQVAFTLGGEVPLLEIIAPGDDRLLLRTGLGDLLGLEGRDPGEALDPALEELGVPAAGREALAISFRGGWVALTDVSSLGDLLGDATAGEGDAAPALDLDRVLDEVTVLGVGDVGEVRRFDVEVRTAPLLAPLGLEVEERTVPGTIDLRDGRLLEARLELAGGDLGDTPGSDASAGGVIEVVLRVAPAEAGGPVVERPEPGASLTSAELFDLVERLQGVTGRTVP